MPQIDMAGPSQNLVPQTQFWASTLPRWKSLSSYPNPWALTCCLPGCTKTGSWKEELSKAQAQALQQCGMCASQQRLSSPLMHVGLNTYPTLCLRPWGFTQAQNSSVSTALNLLKQPVWFRSRFARDSVSSPRLSVPEDWHEDRILTPG